MKGGIQGAKGPVLQLRGSKGMILTALRKQRRLQKNKLAFGDQLKALVHGKPHSCCRKAKRPQYLEPLP